ncbi:recombinase family protein [Streptomyces sp. 71268]|uniref:recombinase family protein n=1 Tax=Streptomyces sp. 71268 TaxID=3002640 RepID=UPI0023F6A412|nr:recombinase family protein [Streptomyces sp. 71268]WEV27926.1 recombinase family protein [Streptomyces sp. 71268]
MREVDLYLRKSKRDRRGVKALSFKAQETRGRKWADDHGYSVRKIWKDNLSAWTDTKRPGFDRALSALRAEEVPTLWCYAGDRLTRAGSDLIAPLLTAGRRLIFDYERLDSDDPRDRRRIIDRAEEAREFSDLLSYRVRDTKTTQRREGAWLGGAPYGFRIADKDTRKLEQDSTRVAPGVTAWDVVIRIFREVSEGRSARQVARRLNADGIPSARGAAWGFGAIHRLISSPVYEGWQVVVGGPGGRSLVWRDEKGKRVSVLAEGTDPVPGELVSLARQVIAGHAPVADATDNRGRVKHPLSGLLRCSNCGSGMVLHGNSYRCNRHTSGGSCLNPATVMQARIEEYVFGRWAAEVSRASIDAGDPLMLAVAERWQALTQPEQTEEARAAIAAVKAAEAAIEQLANDRAAGLYRGAMGKHFPRLVAEAETTLSDAQEHASTFSVKGLDVTMFDETSMLHARWEAADDALRRDLLRLAIDKVTVSRGTRGARFDGDDRCVITWAHPADAAGEA